MTSTTYVHGYTPREAQRLRDQAGTLAELLHHDTAYPPGSRVLEAGCGVGAQTVELARRSPGAAITAVDISSESLAAAERRVRDAGLDGVRFRQADLLDLPGTAGEEADLEGMAVADGFLWVVGSHGLKRKNAKPDRGHADNAKRLAKVALDGNRRLLACLPIEPEASGEPASCRGRRATERSGRRAGLPAGIAGGVTAL